MATARSRRPWYRLTSPLLWVAVIAAACGAGIGAWEYVIEQRVIAKRFGVVEEGRVYRSGQVSEYLIEEVLVDHDIRVVIDLTSPEPELPAQVAEGRAILKLGIERYRYPMAGDGTGSMDAVADAVTTLHRAVRSGQPVLVHCSAGSQRTAHVLSAYLLLVRGVSAEEVDAHMRRYDWDPGDSPDWPAQLNARMGELAELLRGRGVIERVPDPLPEFGRPPG